MALAAWMATMTLPRRASSSTLTELGSMRQKLESCGGERGWFIRNSIPIPPLGLSEITKAI